MVLPREDLMARSPSVFFSATSPEGWEPFQDQLAVEHVSSSDFRQRRRARGDDMGYDGEER